MKKSILISLALFLIFSQTAAYASKDNDRGQNDKLKAEKEIQPTGKPSDSDDKDDQKDTRWTFTRNQNNNGDFLKENDNEFMIKGNITSTDSASFTIMGKTIKIDKSVTKQYKQTGNLVTGMHAIVKGIKVNGIYYAENVVVDNRNKWKVFCKNNDDKNNSSTPSATITPCVTPTEKHDKDATKAARFQEKRVERLQNRIDFFENLIKRLQTLLDNLKAGK